MPDAGYATHEVLNQAGALHDYNAFTDDIPLVETARVFGAGWAEPDLSRASRYIAAQLRGC